MKLDDAAKLREMQNTMLEERRSLIATEQAKTKAAEDQLALLRKQMQESAAQAQARLEALRNEIQEEKAAALKKLRQELELLKQKAVADGENFLRLRLEHDYTITINVLKALHHRCTTTQRATDCAASRERSQH